MPEDVKTAVDHAPFRRLRRHALAVASLAAAALAVYWHVLGHQFLANWDDAGYVTNNPVIHDLSWRGIRTVFGRSYFYNYAPIHLLSYMVDDALWGLRPSAFALTNVVLHAANGVLFYLLLVKLGWRRLAAWAAALIFLVHPVQVESVAWISQRKAVLSLFFFLLALLAFVRYRRTDGRRRWVLYAGSLLAFGLALLTKATTVVFPLIAVLFDRHFERERSRSTWLLDKLPFLGAAAAVAVATVRAQSPEMGGGRATTTAAPPSPRS